VPVLVKRIDIIMYCILLTIILPRNLKLPNIWCCCRILVASLTVVERFADCAVSWLPMYGEAKLALIVYLWHPNTRVRMLLIGHADRTSTNSETESRSSRARGKSMTGTSGRCWRGTRRTSTGAWWS
jgi:hypothetical protein